LTRSGLERSFDRLVSEREIADGARKNNAA